MPSERVSGEMRFRSSSNTSTAVRKVLTGFRSRTIMDASGFASLASTIQPWNPNDSLQKIAEAWKQPGIDALAKLEPNLQAARQSGDAARIFNGLMIRAMFLNSDGEAKRAYENLEEARSLLKKNETLEQYFLYSVVYLQGVTALRRGENENCIECRGESSCILPISAAAVHSNPTGSRLAIRHFTEYLEQFPSDLEARWLLNLAHMTLGEYPEMVNPAYMIPLDRFAQFRVRHWQIPRRRTCAGREPVQSGWRRDHGRLRR